MLAPGRTLTLPNAAATARAAEMLGGYLQAGDTVLLQGDVGAGKSHFARSLILSRLHAPEDVPSPTFTLVQTYETPQATLWHADLYRLSDMQEIEELGLVEAFEGAICLIEWPDRLGALTPSSALTLSLGQGDNDDARELMVTWTDPKWPTKLEGWTI